MSSFETKNFEFFSYDFSSEAHRKFAKELINDSSIREYIKDIETFIYRDTEDPLNNAYLVATNEEIVGYINLYEYRRIVDIDLAVGASFRGIRNSSNETIGCQILKETSEYLLDNYEFIKYLRVIIARGNIRSIKTALSAGFKYVDHFSEGNEYHKYRYI